MNNITLKESLKSKSYEAEMRNDRRGVCFSGISTSNSSNSPSGNQSLERVSVNASAMCVPQHPFVGNELRHTEKANFPTASQSQWASLQSSSSKQSMICSSNVPSRMPGNEAPFGLTPLAPANIDWEAIFAFVSAQKLPRKVPLVPFVLSPMHLYVDGETEDVIEKIRETLRFLGIDFDIPDAISTFFITGHPNDSELRGEIRIYRDLDSENTLVVEACRLGGDGFLMYNIFAEVNKILRPEDFEGDEFDHNQDIDNMDFTDDFNGIPMSDRYNSLLCF